MEQIGYEKFKEEVERSMGKDNCDWYFVYRIRVGINY